MDGPNGNTTATHAYFRRRARPQLLQLPPSFCALAAQLADAWSGSPSWKPTWSAIGQSGAGAFAASNGTGVPDPPSGVPPTRVSSWDPIVGVTGLVLCRHVLSGPRHRSRQRIEELRTLLAAGHAGWEAVPATELAPLAGYALWAAAYDAPGNPVIAVEQPSSGPSSTERHGGARSMRLAAPDATLLTSLPRAMKWSGWTARPRCWRWQGAGFRAWNCARRRSSRCPSPTAASTWPSARWRSPTCPASTAPPPSSPAWCGAAAAASSFPTAIVRRELQDLEKYVAALG